VTVRGRQAETLDDSIRDRHVVAQALVVTHDISSLEVGREL
jgi:hypothetical protein